MASRIRTSSTTPMMMLWVPNVCFSGCRQIDRLGAVQKRRRWLRAELPIVGLKAHMARLCVRERACFL
jgi:hypothetical protein